MKELFTGFLKQYEKTHDKYLVAQLVQKDMRNFAYVKRDGDIFEVVNGAEPVLRLSCNWSEQNGGINPWYIQYNSAGEIVFFDMASNALFRISGNNIYHVVPNFLFEPLAARGEEAALRGFGFFNNTYAGVYGDTVWLYDGSDFTVYEKIRIDNCSTLRGYYGYFM